MKSTASTPATMPPLSPLASGGAASNPTSSSVALPAPGEALADEKPSNGLFDCVGVRVPLLVAGAVRDAVTGVPVLLAESDGVAVPLGVYDGVSLLDGVRVAVELPLAVSDAVPLALGDAGTVPVPLDVWLGVELAVAVMDDVSVDDVVALADGE